LHKNSAIGKKSSVYAECYIFVFFNKRILREEKLLPNYLILSRFYPGVPSFRLLHGNPATTKNTEIEFLTEEEAADFSRIRCPLCKWQPKETSRWFCADAGFPEYYSGGCGAMWNTFATGGVCVGCNHRWRWTTCLRCAEWSRHENWYAKKSD